MKCGGCKQDIVITYDTDTGEMFSDAHTFILFDEKDKKSRVTTLCDRCAFYFRHLYCLWGLE
jgi:hypothetical protein